MDEYTENKFGYLRKLSTDEQLKMLEDLKHDNEFMENQLKDKNVSGEQKTEFYNDIRHNEEMIEYLNSIIDTMKR